MQLYFRPTTTKMLGNLKIFTIAMLMRSVLGRTFSVIQYEALFLLVAGEGATGGGRRAQRPGRQGGRAARGVRHCCPRARNPSHAPSPPQKASP
jgi:hypothetical protein